MSGALLLGLGVGRIVLFHAAQVVCGRAIGVVPESVALFVGPKLASFTAGGTEYRLNLVPSEVGASLVRAYMSLLAANPVAAIGVLALKVSALNLLPFSGSPGGMIWRSALRLKAEDPRLLVPRLLGSIAGMGLGFSWLAAIWQGLA